MTFFRSRSPIQKLYRQCLCTSYFNQTVSISCRTRLGTEYLFVLRAQENKFNMALNNHFIILAAIIKFTVPIKSHG